MKSRLLPFLLSIVLMSCQPSGHMPEDALQDTQPSVASEYTWPQATFTENTEWHEFREVFGTRLTLERDFCLEELCIYQDFPVYQWKDGYIMQLALMRMKELDETDEYGIPKTAPEMIKYVEATPSPHSTDEAMQESKYGYEFLHIVPQDEYASDKADDTYIMAIVANPRNNSIASYASIFLSVEEIRYQKLGDVMLKSEAILGCGGGTIHQHFLDAHGKEIEDIASAFARLPKTIPFNGITLTYDHQYTKSGEAGIYIPGYSEADHVWIQDALSLDDDLASQLISKQMGQADYYYLHFAEYPNVTFAYKNSLPRALAYLTGALARTETNEVGEIVSREETIRILEGAGLIDKRTIWVDGAEKTARVAFSIRKKEDQANSFGLEIDHITAEMMPMLLIKRLPNGDGLLFLHEKYQEFTMAELCKPLVYIYDTNPAPNTLTVTLPQGGDFTALIPRFSYGNTWNFTANAASLLHSEGQDLRYLYYSARVPHYTFNRDGWQVYGRDIEAFFHEKLEYIGFNATEKSDFIDFWKTEFDQNQLYFVSFKFDESIDAWAKLEFAREPKRHMRVLLEAFPITLSNISFLYPHTPKVFDTKILKTFVRSGEFDVFEWGGVVQKSYYHSPRIR